VHMRKRRGVEVEDEGTVQEDIWKLDGERVR
jgi:hypothetical protein